MVKRAVFRFARFVLNGFPKSENFLVWLFRKVGISRIVSSWLTKIGFWEQREWVAHREHPNLNPGSKRMAEVVNWLKDG
jgi:hypothetical protein